MPRRLVLCAGLTIGAVAGCADPVVDEPPSVTVPALPATSAATAPATTAVVVETTASGSDGYESG